MDFKGKVAWITGGARMGLAVAQSLFSTRMRDCSFLPFVSEIRTEATIDQLTSDGR